MDQPRVWFRQWLKEHKAINPHKEWARYEAAGFALVYRGWVRAFRVRGVTRDLARAASVQMQAEPTLYPEKHLARVLKLAGRAKEQALVDAQARTTQERIARARADDRRQDRIKELWGNVPDEVRDTYRDWARNAVPELADFPGTIEFMARNRWADLSNPSRNRQTAGA